MKKLIKPLTALICLTLIILVGYNFMYNRKVRLETSGILLTNNNPDFALPMDISLTGKIKGNLLDGHMSLTAEGYTFDSDVHLLRSGSGWIFSTEIPQFIEGAPSFQPVSEPQTTLDPAPQLPLYLFVNRGFTKAVVIFGIEVEFGHTWNTEDGFAAVFPAGNRENAMKTAMKIAPTWDKGHPILWK